MDIKAKIEKWIGETLGIDGVIPLVHPAHIENGDFTFITDPKLASEYADKLNTNKIAEVGEIKFVAPRFINIYLSKDFFAHSINEVLEEGENFGKSNVLEGEKTIVEYTDPNPFKEFHIGHLMPNVIGESISRLVEVNGSEVKRANYQGDLGIHVACAVWGIKDKGGIIFGDDKENIEYLGLSYAHGANSLKQDENLKSEIQEINKKLYEKSDEELNKIYEWGRKVSLDYFEGLYNKLGTKFDFYFFESEVGEFGKQIVLEFLKKGVFEESEGAIVFKGENRYKKLHTRVFINSQGLPVYEAKELGLSKIKYDKYNYTKSIIVTANEIQEYFKVLLTAMKEVFPELAEKTTHISHGIMKLPTGKMSSRTGDVITFLELFSDVKERILEKIKDRGFGVEEQESIAEVVAIGAIKYTILRQAVGGDIIFDFDKSISFEGDSGPYLQYTYVRAKSILEKAQIEIVSKSPFDTVEPLENWETKEVEKILYRFPEVVEKAGREYSPHYLVTYLIELAGAFNSFYANEKIVDESDPNSEYKLAITQAVSTVLKNGLNLLGIKVPERM